MILLALLLACRPEARPVDSGAGPFPDAPPSLLGVALACDPEAGAWGFQLHTQGWSGLGRIWMTTDGAITEAHDLRSAAADPRGAWDCLQGSIAVAADLRDVVEGSTTRFRCDALPRMGLRVAVADTGLRAWADCRSLGAAAAQLDGVDGVPPCEALVELPAEQLETGAVSLGEACP